MKKLFLLPLLIFFSVHIFPQISIQFTIGNISCYGGSDGSLTASASGGTAPYSYHWGNGQTTASIYHLSLNYYTVTVTDAHANMAVDSAWVPSPAFYWDSVYASGPVCNGDSTGSVYSIVIGGTPPYSYHWSNVVIDSNGEITNLAPGAYNVTVTDAAGCNLYDSITIAGWPPFTASFTLLPADLPHHWYLLYTYSGSSPVSYEWNWGDGDTSSGPHPTHVYADSGYYDICMTLTDSNGCIAHYCDSSTFLRSAKQLMVSVNAVTQLPTGLGDLVDNNFTLYPNPAEKSLHINTGMPGNIRYQILNPIGDVLMQGQTISNTFDIDINTLSGGLYFVRLRSESGEDVRRFIKQ